MANFVLVHGSFHGAWCWERFAPALRARGHRVETPNLPGSGDDPAPLENAGLRSYATRVAGTIDALPGPVVLVGHSMGGIVSSQVAEWRADRLQAVVYVCGLLLGPGETLATFLQTQAHLGVEDLVLKNMKVAADGRTATFPEALAPEIFYNRCDPAVARWAANKLGPQATQVYADPLALSAERFGASRRFYVEALQDRAVSPLYQRAMVERVSCEEVFTLDCDHSPFLSEPEALLAILEEVAGKTG